MEGALHKFAIYIKGVNGMDHIIVSSKPSHQYLSIEGSNMILSSLELIFIKLLMHSHIFDELQIENRATQIKSIILSRMNFSQGMHMTNVKVGP